MGNADWLNAVDDIDESAIKETSLSWRTVFSKKSPEIIPEVSETAIKFANDEESLPGGLISFAPIVVAIAVCDGIANTELFLFCHNSPFKP